MTRKCLVWAALALSMAAAAVHGQESTGPGFPSYYDAKASLSALCCGSATGVDSAKLLSCIERKSVGPPPSPPAGKKAKQPKQSADGLGRVLLLTEVSDDELDFGSHTAAINAAYAAAHGYSFLVERTPKVAPGTETQTRAAEWNKLALIMKHIRTGLWDWIVWADADAAIVNQAISMRLHVNGSGPEHMLIASTSSEEKPGRVHVIDTGVMIVRAAEGALALLEMWSGNYHPQKLPHLHDSMTSLIGNNAGNARSTVKIMEMMQLSSHGRLTLSFPYGAPTISSTPLVAHFWDQMPVIRLNMLRRGHAEQCRVQKQGLQAPAFDRKWMIEEVIKGVDAAAAAAEQYGDWGMARAASGLTDKEFDEEFGEELDELIAFRLDPDNDPAIKALPAGFWNDSIPQTVLNGHAVRELVGNAYFAAAEAEELGLQSEGFRLAQLTVRIAAETDCAGCDWYARDALIQMARIHSFRGEPDEAVAACREATKIDPVSKRGRDCLREVSIFHKLRLDEIVAEDAAAAAAAEAEAAKAEGGAAAEGGEKTEL